MFGLRQSDITSIHNVLQAYPEVKKAIIFGSRAKGNYKNGSDVDLAIFGDSLNYEVVLNISEFLNEETLMPYFFDVHDYNLIQSKELIEHIDRAGKLLYEKSS